MRTIYIIIALSFWSFKSYAQQDAFDFWLGEWELSWTNKEGKTKKGQNSIEKVLNGKIIQENFSTLEDEKSERFIGKSWTAFNKRTKEWKQTWVDNSGSYLDFSGFVKENKKGFQRSFTNSAGEKIYQRMIFYDISDNSFTWDWESSKDSETWKLLWRINYKRKISSDD